MTRQNRFKKIVLFITHGSNTNNIINNYCGHS